MLLQFFGTVKIVGQIKTFFAQGATQAGCIRHAETGGDHQILPDENLTGRSGGKNSPFRHDDQTGGQAGHVIHAVGNHNNRNIIAGVKLFQHGKNPVATARVQPGRGFIQNQNGGFHGQHAGDGHAAHLATGELEGTSCIVLIVIQMNAIHGITDALIDFRF